MKELRQESNLQTFQFNTHNHLFCPYLDNDADPNARSSYCTGNILAHDDIALN